MIRSTLDTAWLSDLQLSLDWYRIRIDDAVVFVSATDAVSNCFNADLNPSYHVDNFWCTTFSRDPTTGEVVDAHGTFRNFALQETSGIDAQLNWAIAAGAGNVHVTWFVSWLEFFDVQSTPIDPADEFAGTIGGFAGSYPEWKSNLRVGYTLGAFDVGVTWRYVDSMKDGARNLAFAIAPNHVSVPHRDYCDVDLSYRFDQGALNGLQLRAGIENLTDEQPNLFPSWSNANTDASQYDVLGRRYLLGMEYTF